MDKLIIHGGAGSREGQHAEFEQYAEHLDGILAEAYAVLLEQDARQAVFHAVRLLEDDPLFNAGTGSRLQRDRRARMSAALMDSERRRFAGVINIEDVRHPIDVVEHLIGEEHSVLCGSPALRYARDLGFEEHDPITPHRLREHQEKLRQRTGTVGAVALDGNGLLCAGTSTGGMGFEIPGRVSDSATVAGNYAGATAGVSCTGIGEHIVDHAAAARIVTRCEDGMSLRQAVDRTLEEALRRDYGYGVIALGTSGEMLAAQTPGVTTLYASHDGEHRRSFLTD